MSNVTFGKPVIGPKAYLACGPSGWIEAFRRDEADKALAVFVAPHDIQELITGFWTKVYLSNEEDWGAVTSYLAKVTNKHSFKDVPVMVAVAFWAQAIIYQGLEAAN